MSTATFPRAAWSGEGRDGKLREALARSRERGEIAAAEYEWALDRLESRQPNRGRATLSPERIRDFVRAAARVFRRRGFDRASVEEIAAELGVRKGAIYHYFASKQDLFDAVCLTGAHDVGIAVAEAAAVPGSVETRLRGMLQAYAEVQGRNPAIAVLVRAEAELSVEAHRKLLVERQAMRALFTQAVADGHGSGEFDVGDVEVGMKWLLGGLAWVNSWLDLEPEVRPVISAGIIDILLRGLLKRHDNAADAPAHSPRRPGMTGGGG